MPLQVRDFEPGERPFSSARELPDTLHALFQGMLDTGTRLLAEEFKGVTEAGSPETGLFSLDDLASPSTGVNTAAKHFGESLNADQRESALFPIDSDAWRRWSNIHPYLMRHGTFMDELA
jgi:hypothetical protein